MRALLVNIPSTVAIPSNIEATFSNMMLKSPFGFDVIVVDPTTLPDVMGGGNLTEHVDRWKESLDKWLAGHNKLIVLLRPFMAHGHLDNYSWLPINIVRGNKIEDCGFNNFVGDIVTKEHRLRNYLSLHNLVVRAHFRPKVDENDFEPVEPLSQIDPELLTSFVWSDGDKEIFFVPSSTLDNMYELVSSFGGGGGLSWDTTESRDLAGKIEEIDSQMNELEGSKTALSEKLNNAYSKVDGLIQQDVYLERAINSYNLAKTSENPDPDNFYEAIEGIEKAFPSERKMQEELGLTKNFIDKIMSRTNEFRHVAKDGKAPQPLTQEEVEDFAGRVEKVISSYIQYLYDKN